MAAPERTKILPFFWYAKEAEEAAKFYASVFPNSRVDRVATMQKPSPGERGHGPARAVPFSHGVRAPADAARRPTTGRTRPGRSGPPAARAPGSAGKLTTTRSTPARRTCVPVHTSGPTQRTVTSTSSQPASAPPGPRGRAGTRRGAAEIQLEPAQLGRRLELDLEPLAGGLRRSGRPSRLHAPVHCGARLVAGRLRRHSGRRDGAKRPGRPPARAARAAGSRPRRRR